MGRGNTFRNDKTYRCRWSGDIRVPGIYDLDRDGHTAKVKPSRPLRYAGKLRLVEGVYVKPGEPVEHEEIPHPMSTRKSTYDRWTWTWTFPKRVRGSGTVGQVFPDRSYCYKTLRRRVYVDIIKVTVRGKYKIDIHSHVRYGEGKKGPVKTFYLEDESIEIDTGKILDSVQMTATCMSTNPKKGIFSDPNMFWATMTIAVRHDKVIRDHVVKGDRLVSDSIEYCKKREMRLDFDGEHPVNKITLTTQFTDKSAYQRSDREIPTEDIYHLEYRMNKGKWKSLGYHSGDYVKPFTARYVRITIDEPSSNNTRVTVDGPPQKTRIVGVSDTLCALPSVKDAKFKTKTCSRGRWKRY